MDADEKQRILKTSLQVRVDADKKKLHPVLMLHKAACREWTKQYPLDLFASLRRDPCRHIPEGEPAFYMNVSAEAWPRLYRILDALCSAIEALGGSIDPDLSVHIRSEHVKFWVTEGQSQVAHTLTKAELDQLKQYEKEK